MKKLISSLKRQEGFTLVELMVVVAIIGLLSAVAIPNFKKYQARSKITEAKLQLSALYTAEQSFFSDYNIYAGCLRYMGFDPEPQRMNRYFAVGFFGAAGIAATSPTAASAAVNAGLQMGVPTGCDLTAAVHDGTLSTTDNRATYFMAGKGVGAAIVDGVADATANAAGVALAAASCTTTSMAMAAAAGTCVGDQAATATTTFQAGAVGIISGDYQANASAAGLNITQAKQFKNIVLGY